MRKLSFEPSVLVMGAGELGDAVLNAVLTHPSLPSNTVVSVLLRVTQDMAKQAQIASFKSRGISVISGNILSSSESELAVLFKPFHTIIGCTGMTYPPGTQLKIGRAVLAAGVQRHFPWQFGVDYDVIRPRSSQNLFTEQLEVRALLRGQTKTRWVIVSTQMFTSFLFDRAFGVVSEDCGKVTALGSWENTVTVTTPKDIGRIVAELVWSASDVEGVVYIVENSVGGSVTRVEWTVDKLKKQLAEDPDNGMRKYRVVFAEGHGVSWDAAGTFNVQRGLKLETAEEWARKNLTRRA